LRLVPLTLKAANAFVAEHHRHHKPDQGHKFSVAVEDDTGIVGVAICGRPKGRGLDNGRCLEVTRLCTTGAKNACSMLYGAAARAALAMGYDRIVTYTLPEEGGASLRAVGWTCDGVVRKTGVGWSNRPGRKEEHPEPKTRWSRVFNAAAA
jgi:hypothetical protein